MEKLNFEETVRGVVARDDRFDIDAFQFLRDALDVTVNELRPDELEEHRHVSGPELLRGFVDHAIREFGSMSVAVLQSWGITRAEHVGEMVFLLIEAGAFGRSEEDSPADFKDVLDLREELLAPFRPKRYPVAERSDGSNNEPPSRGNQPARPSEL